MLRFPSIVRSYDAYCSADPAIKQPPTAPAPDASDEAKKAFAEELVAYVTALNAAHDTGKWDDLILPGQQPTKFILQPVEAETFRALVDLASLPETNPRHIGGALEQALLVRLALVNVVGVDFQVKRSVDARWGWEMAQPEVIQILDSVNRRIVGELAQAIGRRAVTRPLT